MDTFGGTVFDVEWDPAPRRATGPLATSGESIRRLKVSGRRQALDARSRRLTGPLPPSPNAPSKRDVLGTARDAIGSRTRHWRYGTSRRCAAYWRQSVADMGMTKVRARTPFVDLERLDRHRRRLLDRTAGLDDTFGRADPSRGFWPRHHRSSWAYGRRSGRWELQPEEAGPFPRTPPRVPDAAGHAPCAAGVDVAHRQPSQDSKTRPPLVGLVRSPRPRELAAPGSGRQGLGERGQHGVVEAAGLPDSNRSRFKRAPDAGARRLRSLMTRDGGGRSGRAGTEAELRLNRLEPDAPLRGGCADGFPGRWRCRGAMTARAISAGPTAPGGVWEFALAHPSLDPVPRSIAQLYRDRADRGERASTS